MKVKIIKQFGAAIAAMLILYGIVATTYRSYETVLAAQVEIPPAIVVKNTSAEVETETPVVTATATTPAVTTTETASTSETASVTTAPTVESTPVVVTTAPKQEETTAIAVQTPVVQDPVVTEPTPAVPTLSEFLSQFRCGGCGKNCSLLNPRCGTGSRKAQQEEATYYATYS